LKARHWVRLPLAPAEHHVLQTGYFAESVIKVKSTVQVVP